MTFDMNVAVAGMGLGVPDPDKIPPGEEASIEVILTVPVVLPFSSGPGQGPITAPLGTIRFALGRAQAIEYFTAALEKAKDLPEKPNLMIASNMHQVDHAAQQIRKVAGSGQ